MTLRIIRKSNDIKMNQDMEWHILLENADDSRLH